MQSFSGSEIGEFLGALGEILDAEGVSVDILIVGGAALTLAGWIPPRPTQDVDVLARVDVSAHGLVLEPPETLPAEFRSAIGRVARDFDLPETWMNTEIALQWKTGLPPSATEGISWLDYGSLGVGLAGRQTMIALKLFAAVDRGPDSVHYQDLVALQPTETELDAAAEWVNSQDATTEFPRIVNEVKDHVLARLREDPTNRR